MPASKILILGGGYAALRFVESLIWTEKELCLCGTGVLRKTRQLSNQFGVPYMEFEELTPSILNGFDCVIVTLPVDVKCKYIGRILDDLQYKNAMIIEKPIALTMEDVCYYERSLSQLDRCAVVCQRDFYLDRYAIPEAPGYQMFFPSYELDPDFNRINMLPHVVSWLLAVDDSLTRLQWEDGRYCGVWRRAPYTLQFVDRRQYQATTINGREYPNVQYREVNAQIVERVLSFNKEKSRISIDRAIKVSKIIMTLS